MRGTKSEPRLTDHQERQLLKAGAAAIDSDFPNPERRGCPMPETVRNLARRRIPLEATGDLVDHVATCSPCFDTYNRYRRQRRLVRVAAPALIGAFVLLGLAVAWRHLTVHDVNSQPQVARVPDSPILHATIDYRESSPSRSLDQVHPKKTPTAPKALLNLTVLLPFGTEDGQYAIEVRNSMGRAVKTASGVAQWDGSAEILTAALDLRGLPAGNYMLAVRKAEASWHSYPLVLE
jgi:hypothetical protein